MRIATWNINSVRLRLELVSRFVADYAPDILCLQETKCPDADFPHAAFETMGFAHRHIRGEKSYNGVAILSRLPFASCAHELWAGIEDTRHVSVVLANGVEVHNFYVPAGGDVADAEKNPKFAHKLRFIDEIGEWFGTSRDTAKPLLLLGDLNIAFCEHDVWSHKALTDVVSYTEIEREKLWGIFNGFGWHDAVRGLHGTEEKLFSWWSYRAKDWAEADRGRRLDHIWASRAMADSLQKCRILRDYRGVPRPSDHVPIILDVAV